MPQISISQNTMDTAASQSTPVPKSGKVCIVCSYFYSDKAAYAVMISDVQLEAGGSIPPTFPIDMEAGGDVSDESVISIRPTFLIDRTSLDCMHNFCVLNSTLYMIQMPSPKIRPPLRGKSVYTCDLSPYLKDSGGHFPSLGEDELLAAPEMLSPKFFPFVTPTPDGKRIVVFSSTIAMSSFENAVDEEIDFEVYDPEKKAWRKLPSLRDFLLGTGRDYFEDIVIQGYTFLTSSYMLFQTGVGIFKLDIDSTVGWREQDSYVGVGRIPFRKRFWVVKDDKIQLCLGDLGVYDISPWAKTEYKECVFDSSMNMVPWYPKLSFDFDMELQFGVQRSFVTNVVYDKEHGPLVVNLQTALEMHKHKPYMLLHVSRYELKKYKEDYRKKKNNNDKKKKKKTKKKKEEEVVEGDGPEKKCLNEKTKKKKEEEVVEGEGPEKKKCLNASFATSFKFKLGREPCWGFVPLCVSVIGA